jgi:hypothetical protein
MQNYFLSLAIVCIVFSCNIHQEKKGYAQKFSNPKSLKHQLFGTWQLQSKTINQDRRVVAPNLVDQLSSCDRDDIEILEPNGYWHTHEGATSCEHTTPTEMAHGDWWISDDSKLIIMFNDGETITYDLSALSNDTFTRLSSFKRNNELYLVKEVLIRKK